MSSDIRVSISEASRLLGVSVKTIRQAIKGNEIVYIIVNGRYKLNFKSLILWSQLSTRRRNLMTSDGIGQYVDKWKINNTKYSPRPPNTRNTSALKNTESDLKYIESGGEEEQPRI